MQPIRVTRAESHRPASPSEPAPINRFNDHKLENEQWRAANIRDKAEICIGVEAGDELGEFVVNLQFERTHLKDEKEQIEQRKLCVQGHQRWFDLTSEWLRETLTSLGGDFDLEIDVFPCPKIGLDVKLENATAILEGNANAETLQTEIQNTEEHGHEL